MCTTSQDFNSLEKRHELHRQKKQQQRINSQTLSRELHRQKNLNKLHEVNTRIPLLDCYYSTVHNSLMCTHTGGYYSCIVQTINSIVKLLSNNIVPKNISFCKTHFKYKNQYNYDNYMLLYRYNSDYSVTHYTSQPCFLLDSNASYVDLNFNFYTNILNTYFQPSNIVIENINKLLAKYNIIPKHTIAVLHRGTDKWLECQLADVDSWCLQLDRIIVKNPLHKIILQTDCEHTRDYILHKYSDKCIYFDEMLFSKVKSEPVTPTFNKLKWCVDYDSITRIISTCDHILTHSGNTSAMSILYRGSVKNVVQLLSNGVFQEF